MRGRSPYSSARAIATSPRGSCAERGRTTKALAQTARRGLSRRARGAVFADRAGGVRRLLPTAACRKTTLWASGLATSLEAYPEMQLRQFVVIHGPAPAHACQDSTSIHALTRPRSRN
jgi:hypothetical protein